MAFSVSSRSVLFVVFLLCLLVDSRLALAAKIYSPTGKTDGFDHGEKTFERSTRGVFAEKKDKSQVTGEDLENDKEAENGKGNWIQRKESKNFRSGGLDPGTEYKKNRKNEGIEEKTVLRDSRKSANFLHRSILQAQSRKEIYKQPVDYQLYEEPVALATTQLWPTEWIPEDDRFLLGYCQSGRLSNRVLCILNALNFAAALNRTLLLTMNRNAILEHYDRRLIFDISYFRSCYGNKSIMTIEEYRDIHGKDVVVDQIVCLCRKPCRLDFSNPNATYLNQGHVTFSESALKFKLPREYVRSVTVDELKMDIGDSPGRILFMGEFFYNNLKTKNYLILPVKRSDQCTSNVAVLPHRSILDFGKLFVKDVFQGQKYMAVHLRREDFSMFCNRGLGCFLSIEHIVECLKDKVKLYDTKMVFLATNTNIQEIEYIMHNLTDKNNERVQIVRLKTELLKENKWVLPIPEEDEDIRSLWEAELDKVICLHAPVFVGSARSTFSIDIERMRYGFGYASPHDTYLCEEPRL